MIFMILPTKVVYLDGYNLLITFNNDEQRIFNASQFFDDPWFSPLKDIALYKQVAIVYETTIEWPGGIDICPDDLYAFSKPYTSKIR